MKKNLLLLFFSILLMVALGEGFARIYLKQDQAKVESPRENWIRVPEQIWTEYHPVLGWVHQKNKHAKLQTQHFDVPVMTNSAGLRGEREYDTAKPKSVTRLLVLGDSFVFGFGVNEEDTFARRLENRDTLLEVLNFGVPGYGIDQILLQYRSFAQKYETDLVLIGVFPEMFWRATRAFTDSGYAKPYFILSKGKRLLLKNVPVPEPYKLRNDQFPDLVEAGSFERLLIKSAFYRLLKPRLLKLGRNLRMIDPETSEEWIVGREILYQLTQEIRAAKAIPVLVILPPDRWVQSDRKTSLRKSLLRFSERHDVKMIDLTPYFTEAVKKSKLTDYYMEGDWHWTAQGHKLAADKISQYLLNIL